jgi:type VI secretion system protein ImpE
MGLQDWLGGGDPNAALNDLQDKVRKNPSDPKLRIFLFQLLAVEGRWDRALTQLKVAGELDSTCLAMERTYREALLCEALRDEIFAGTRSPLVFGQPETWIALMIEALRLAATGETEPSQQIRNEALDAAPATPGRLDDQPFEWLADADPRLGPILEAIINGRYYWVPFHRIRAIRIDAPADLRDIVWTPAAFTWANGGESVGLIPTRYPGTPASDNPQLRLARRTEWVDQGSDLFTGRGQRMLATDAGDYPIMDVRTIRLETASEPIDQEAMVLSAGQPAMTR